MDRQREVRLVTYTDNQLRGEKVYFLVDENGVMLTEPVRKEEIESSSDIYVAAIRAIGLKGLVTKSLI